MSTSMVSTVLEIEREAEAILNKAEGDAAAALTQAKSQREEAAKFYADGIKKEIAGIEEKAAADRALRVQELTTSGEKALAAVRNISDEAFNKGVQYIMDALAKK